MADQFGRCSRCAASEGGGGRIISRARAATGTMYVRAHNLSCLCCVHLMLMETEREIESGREGASLRCMAFGLPSSSALLEESQQRMTTGTQPFEQMNSDRPAELEPS